MSEIPHSPRVIAIGDIHGCAIALEKLLAAVAPDPSDTIVTLGDHIDWGPDSRGVLDMLIGLSQRCRLIPLLGNHEEMLLAARQSRTELVYWMKLGGLATMDSYGQRSTWEDIPRAHFKFIENCQPFYETDQFIFSHANYDPDLPMQKQSAQMLRWEHLDLMRLVPHSSGKTVIVGHTAQTDGDLLDLGFVVGIDTFCSGGGWLTALETATGHYWQTNQQGTLKTGQRTSAWDNAEAD